LRGDAGAAVLDDGGGGGAELLGAGDVGAGGWRHATRREMTRKLRAIRTAVRTQLARVNPTYR
jgi:hypothetical protein